jgi:hypothetical protein
MGSNQGKLLMTDSENIIRPGRACVRLIADGLEALDHVP